MIVKVLALSVKDCALLNKVLNKHRADIVDEMEIQNTVRLLNDKVNSLF